MSDRMFATRSSALANNILRDKKYSDSELVSKLVDENKKRRKRFAEIRTARQRAMDELGRMSGHLKDLKEKLDNVDRTLSSVEDHDDKPFSRAYDQYNRGSPPSTRVRSSSDGSRGASMPKFVHDFPESEDEDLGKKMDEEIDEEIEKLLKKESGKHEPRSRNPSSRSEASASKKFKTHTYLVVKPKDGSPPKVYQEISSFDGIPESVVQTATPAASAAPSAAASAATKSAPPPPMPAPRAAAAKAAAAAAIERKKKQAAAAAAGDDAYAEIPFIDDEEDANYVDFRGKSEGGGALEKSPTVDRRQIPFQAARQRLASAWAQEAKEAWKLRNPETAAQEEAENAPPDAVGVSDFETASDRGADAEVIRLDLESPNFSNVRLSGRKTLVPEGAFTGAVYETRTELLSPTDVMGADEILMKEGVEGLQHHMQFSPSPQPSTTHSGVKWISLESRRKEKPPHGDKYSTPERHLSVKKIEVEQTDTSYIATAEIKTNQEKEVIIDPCYDAFSDLEEQLEQCKTRLSRLKELNFPPLMDDLVLTRSRSFVIPTQVTPAVAPVAKVTQLAPVAPVTTPMGGPIFFDEGAGLKRADSIKSLTGFSNSGRRASIAVEPSSISVSHGAGHSAMCCICRDIYSQGLRDIATIQEKAKGSWVDLSPGMLYRPLSKTLSVESVASNAELEALETELTACRDQLDKLKKMHLGPSMTPVPEEPATPTEAKMAPDAKKAPESKKAPENKATRSSSTDKKPPVPQSTKKVADADAKEDRRRPTPEKPTSPTPFDYVGIYPRRRASIVGAVIPYPNWPASHGGVYGYGFPLNGYITTNPLAPPSQQAFFTTFVDMGEEGALRQPAPPASAAASPASPPAPAKAVSPAPPPVVKEEPEPEPEPEPKAVEAEEDVEPLPPPMAKPPLPTKDRRKGLTFWSLIV